jgi:MtN3 and saliva related transmembrane protein
MISPTALGYVAGFLTTASFLPQVVKAWRTRSTDDLSFWMLGAFSGGVSLWIVYGLMLSEPPIVLFNAITLVLATTLVWLKITHGRTPQRERS